jgi:crotonobetainyl-CoA:carnitine CoA-transferase CaiB-like acyl-CoA transferase
MNMNLQAYTGLMMTTGSEGDPPTSIANSWNDYIGGIHGVIAVLQALEERADSRTGRHIDLSQFECSVATLGPLLMSSAISGRPPKRWGNRSSDAAPQGVYPCAGTDEWCAIVVENDQQWRALAGVIRRPELAADERFAALAGRIEHHDELDAVIAAWTRERTNLDVERRLHEAGIRADRMRRVDDVVRSPDSARVYKPVPGDRPLLAPSLPFTFSKSAIEPLRAPAELGEHTSDVLRDWLRMSAAEIDALEGAHAFA